MKEKRQLFLRERSQLIDKKCNEGNRKITIRTPQQITAGKLH